MTRDKEKQSKGRDAQELIGAIDYLLPEVAELSPEAARRLAEANTLLQQALIDTKRSRKDD